MRDRFVIGCMTLVVMAVCIALLTISSNRNKLYQSIEQGKDLVEAMYQFNDLLELDAKQDIVQELVTDEVFQQIGLDYNDNGLNKYLKFKGDPCYVIFEKLGNGYVIYSLENPNITKSRHFVLFYTVDDSGKINWVREGELYDFA